MSLLPLSRNQTARSGRGGEIRTPDLVRPRHAPSTKLGHSPTWWLVTELNRVHRLFRPALYRRVHEPKSGGRCETRTRIARVQAVCNPLIRTAHLGRDERIELS